MTVCNQIIRACSDTLRRAIAILVACAVILVSLPEGMAVAYALPTHPTPSLQHQHSAMPSATDEKQGGQLPLHVKMGCLSELGCLLMVGILPIPLQVTQQVSWAPVRYWTCHSRVEGITAKPSLDPPIV